MAGKKLSAAERLAKLKAMQGKRGEEFSGGNKKPEPEPPQKEEAPSVFDKPPAKPVQEEPDEDNKTQGLDLDDSSVVDISDEEPSAGLVPSTKADSRPPVREEPEEAEEEPAAPSVADEPEAVAEPEAVEAPEPAVPPAMEEPAAPSLDDEPPSLGELMPPAEPEAPSLDDVDAGREDETRQETPQRSSKPPAARTLLSADLDDAPVAALSEPVQAPAPVVEKVPEGVRYHVNASQNGEQTTLASGIVVNYVMPSASSKMFMVQSPSGATESLALAPGDSKSFELETPDGKVSITMQNKEGEVTAYVKGGVTKSGAVKAKASAAGKFLANVRYYLPEVTMAAVFTAATTAVLWTQQFISDTLQNFHKPAVVAYGVFQLAFTAWAVIEQRKIRKAAEAKEALKQ